MRTLLVSLLFTLTVAASDFTPDPKAVRRHGPGYRYPQAGWIVLHVEGKPYDRGFQHGTLLAPEIASYVRCFAAQQGPKDPAGAWGHVRRLTSALFLRRFDREYLEEMQGIADGAAEAGARFGNRAIDLSDIVAVNCWAEIETLDGGLEALPTGLEGLQFPGKKPKAMPPAKAEHCSAFAATGSATADGKIVFGHITMFALYPSRFYNVWLDVQPDKGHRVLMQSYPGGIQSGMDYYLNDAGLVVCETTISQTRFHGDGLPLANRIRKALQYGESIDDVVRVLTDRNNGLYTNEWLIADTKTNEIAMLELGTTATKLWRSSKKEWFGGTEGFYWGCNNTKDLQVRLDTIADTAGRPRSTAWAPSPRDKKWLAFYEKHKGKITAGSGIEAFHTAPICAASSLDAKVTTTGLVKQLRTHAVFGPPIGGTWPTTDQERAEFPEVVPLVPNDWTILHPEPPPRTEVIKLADWPARAEGFKSIADRMPEELPATKAAWHGTLLPRTDTDLWLTEGFVAYERIVALEHTLRDGHDDGELSADDRERLAVELNLHRAVVTRSAIHEGEREDAGKEKHELPRDQLVRAETGKGVLRLDRLRHLVGDKVFVELMDQFGREHAGKHVTADEFVVFVARIRKVEGNAWRKEEADGPKFTVKTWAEDQERTVIVYGTVADAEANRETAEQIQHTVARRGMNIVIPVLSDTQATGSPDRVTGRHVLLVGGPSTNKLAARWRELFPVSFGTASFQVRDQSFSHPGSAVIAAGPNPLDHVSSVVVIAGLSAEATRFAPDYLLSHTLRPGNVLVIPNQARARSLVVK